MKSGRGLMDFQGRGLSQESTFDKTLQNTWFIKTVSWQSLSVRILLQSGRKIMLRSSLAAHSVSSRLLLKRGWNHDIRDWIGQFQFTEPIFLSVRQACSL